MAKHKNKQPIPVFTTPSNTAIVGVPLIVGMSATDPDGIVTRWKLSWGDGSSSNGTGSPKIANHIYQIIGNFTRRLTVWDNDNASNWIEARTAVSTTPIIIPPLVLTCPSNQIVTSSDGQPVAVFFDEAQTSGGLAPIVTTYDPLRGSQLPRGSTTIKVVSTSADNQRKLCDFTVTVNVLSVPPPGRRLLNKTDFVFQGYLPVPEYITSFSYGALAARKVNGKLQFFMTGENSANAVENWGCMDPVFEFADTQNYNTNLALAQRASLITFWGDIYQGKRVTYYDGLPYPLQYLLVPTLKWKNNLLYWTFLDSYNVAGREDPCIGVTELGNGPADLKAYGPWFSQRGSKHSAGWLVDLPDGSLGIGSPPQSGNAGSSWGPELYGGGSYPLITSPSGYMSPPLTFSQRMLTYPYPGITNTQSATFDINGVPLREITSLLRNGNYVFHNINPSVGYPQPQNNANPLLNNGIGSFCPTDGVSSCVNIDLPDKYGILFAGVFGTEHVWYGPPDECGHGFKNPCGGGQGPNSSNTEAVWWIYEPAKLNQVASGTIPPYLVPDVSFNPDEIASLHWGCSKVPCGMYFDIDTRLLYMAMYRADDSIDGFHLPLIAVFKIKES